MGYYAALGFASDCSCSMTYFLMSDAVKYPLIPIYVVVSNKADALNFSTLFARCVTVIKIIDVFIFLLNKK